MKKILLLFFFSIFLFTGCGKYSEEDVVRDFGKKIDNAKAYYVEGSLELVNNDDGVYVMTHKSTQLLKSNKFEVISI